VFLPLEKYWAGSLRPPTEAVSFRNADFNPNWTMRQKVTELTKAANCMSCHDQINSSGFVLENFDATGKIRTQIQGKPIDLKVEYLDSKGEKREFKMPMISSNMPLLLRNLQNLLPMNFSCILPNKQHRTTMNLK
jgi:hypothetical protein